MLYVRGPLAAFATPGDSIAAAAATSGKDALVVCLLEPPASRAEAPLLDRTRTAYAGGWAVESRTANVRRLHDLVAGLPFLDEPWARSVEQADDLGEVSRLRAAWDRSSVQRTKQAAKATLLLAAMDEPGEGSGPTELDGERPHAIRVALVDWTSGRILLRQRHHVDPAWISPGKRLTYAGGLDACRVALEIHDATR
jgi:hypothetical protein